MRAIAPLRSTKGATATSSSTVATWELPSRVRSKNINKKFQHLVHFHGRIMFLIRVASLLDYVLQYKSFTKYYSNSMNCYLCITRLTFLLLLVILLAPLDCCFCRENFPPPVSPPSHWTLRHRWTHLHAMAPTRWAPDSVIHGGEMGPLFERPKING